MKKILLLADAASSHTQKWAESVKALGFDVMIFSFNKPFGNRYAELNIKLASDSSLNENSDYYKSDLRKASYIKHLRKLKNTIKEFKPDLIHAHYATSYGLMAALCGFKPYFISVWGSDVFDFPKRSFIHKQILKFNLSRAKCVISSSQVMAEETRKYYSGNIEVIPFGIDLSIYKRVTTRSKILTIGIIKSMEDNYGIENIIRAFKQVKQKFPEELIRLLLIGGGSMIEKYKKLVSELGLNGSVEFRGKISQELVPDAHNEIDIFVNPSVHESFGVSVLEASATENPVVVTNVGGLKEVVVSKATGLVVEQTVDDLVKAITYFVENRDQIDIFGKKGRQFVSEKYDLKKVVDRIQKLYLSF